jgi:Tfp pilus assembly protein PilN
VDAKGAGFDAATALVNEVRRTVAAINTQIPGCAVQRVALAAGPGEHEALLESLVRNLEIPVGSFDPFRAVDLARPPAAALDTASSRGAFAAAIGAALSLQEPWPIDFLNPKKPAVRHDRRRPLAMLAGAAALLLVAAAYYQAHQKIAKGKNELQKLSQQQVELTKKLKSAEGLLDEAHAIEDWTKGEINSLEQLRRLSEEFPDTARLYSTSLTISADGSAVGSVRMTLDGVARQRVPIGEFHTALNQGEYFSAQPSGAVQEGSRSGEYRYGFKSSIVSRSRETSGAGAGNRNAAGAPKAKAVLDRTKRAPRVSGK